MTSEEVQISEELKGCYENLIVIDIGANLTNKKYGRDLDSVIQRAKDAGTCVNISTCLKYCVKICDKRNKRIH